MDNYLSVSKSITSQSTGRRNQGPGGKVEKGKHRQLYKHNPYNARPKDEQRLIDSNDGQLTAKILTPFLEKDPKLSVPVLTKHLLKTLSDEANPITHSDIPQRADYVTSAASGHQRGEGRGNERMFHDYRNKKLAEQSMENLASTKECNILYNVRVYINGYLECTTDIEMKHIVTLAGGQVLQTATRATHILTSQQLNGSKTQKLLSSMRKTKPHVVRPEWITDSIKAGKRLPERTYSVIKNEAIKDLTCIMFANAGSSRESPIELE